MTTATRETGQDVAHEKLTGTVTIGEAGYVYIYFSNEEGASASETYWDDLKVTHIKSSVVAGNDYYPFGLTFNNSYARENSLKQDYLYNGKELQDELNLGWLDYGARMYMPEIGRWNSIDCVADMFDDESPYSHAANNPVNVIDVGGYFRISAEFANKYPTLAKMIAYYLPLLQTNKTVKNAWMELTSGTSAQFDEMVTYGSGPDIVPTEPEKANWMDQNNPAHSENSNYNPRYPNNLPIAPGSLEDLEEEMKRAMEGQKNEMGAQMFMVALKVMHEATHYGVCKYRGEAAFWRIEGNAGPWGGDQGARWEGRAYQRFSYKDGKMNPADKGEVFDYYYKNYNRDKMVGMTLQPDSYYNTLILLGPTPGTGKDTKKVKRAKGTPIPGE